MSTTTKSRKPRVKYKVLYQAAQAEAVRQGSRANVLAQQLGRIRAAIAPRALPILDAQPSDASQIVLDPHDYVCVEAWFKKMERFSLDEELTLWTNLSYKQTPIIEKP